MELRIELIRTRVSNTAHCVGRVVCNAVVEFRNGYKKNYEVVQGPWVVKEIIGRLTEQSIYVCLWV